MRALPTWLTRIPPAGWILLAAMILGVHLSSRLYVSDLDGWDAAQYYQMAETVTLRPVEAPFAYRWLPHKAVAMVPLLPAKRVYELVTWGALLVAAFGVARLLKHVGLSPWTAASMATLFLLWAKWGGRFYVWYRAGSDPLAYAVLAWGFVCIAERRLIVLSVLAAIGVACREHALLLFPVYAVRHGWTGGRVAWGPVARAVVAAVPAVAVYLAIRAVTPVTNEFSLAGAMAASVSEKLLTPSGLVATISATLTHNGLLLPLLILGGRRTIDAVRRYPGAALWVVLCLGVGLLGGRDTDRLMFYATFGEIVLLADIIMRDPRLDGVWIGLAVLFHIILSQTFDANLIAANVAPMRPLVEAILFTALLAVTWRLAGSTPDAPAAAGDRS